MLNSVLVQAANSNMLSSLGKLEQSMKQRQGTAELEVIWWSCSAKITNRIGCMDKADVTQKLQLSHATTRIVAGSRIWV
jgi:hypothetical protein